jgi:putative membrane-bound dehydrogenase-like protein
MPITTTRIGGALAVVGVSLLLGGHVRGAWQEGPPYPAAAALKTFAIADGFEIELFAAEPLISSPVAMDVDERGRMFVVEMPGYPLDVSGSGRIKRLEDTDGDGRPDRATVFAEGLRLPTGIMRWKQGVIVTDSPQVWYLEDADGDGRAEIKREVLTGFALTNPQHTTNTPVYGLDNWIYLANEGPVRTVRYRDIFGDMGGEVRFPDRPDGPRLPPDGGGLNVRFRPDTFELEMLASRSQFGQTFDRWGHHFLVGNSRHAYQEVIAARYLARNPALVVPSAVEHIPDYKLPATLFPITQNPEFQLLTDVGVMTAASGLTYYLADLFPPAYRDAIFVAEGAHNLVHAASVRGHGATFRASRMFDGREFLASTDPWFRPVNLFLGPDGALYVIDYYRRILEHPEWLDERTSTSPDLSAGRDRGRIYRIAPAKSAAAAWLDRVDLHDAPPARLVRTLAHPNIWWRRHAQRLLVDRKPPGIARDLLALLTDESPPIGRVHALWTLDALGLLAPAQILGALADDAAGVRENAIRLAELHLEREPALAGKMAAMVEDPDFKVRFQLLLTLGSVDTPAAQTARSHLLFQDLDDEWMQVAALSAARSDAGRLLGDAIAKASDKDTTARRTLFNRIGALAAASPDPAQGRRAIRDVLSATDGAWWRAATLEGVATGLPTDRRKSGELEPERAQLARLILKTDAVPLRRAVLQLLEAIGLPANGATALLDEAVRIASDPAGDADLRADAVRAIALDTRSGHDDLLRSILGDAPSPVQLAALRALASRPGVSAATTFVALWSRWTPGVREEALRAFLREPGRIRILLDALEGGRIKASEIDWPMRVRLMMADDSALRARARGLFGSTTTAAVTGDAGRFAAASTMTGDVERGRQVFSRACSMCHLYRGSGGIAFGPDLGELRGRLPRALMNDILRPNQSIADGYELWVAELDDGSTVTGIISAETPGSVTFRQVGGIETTVARARLASLRIAPVSAMPDNVADQLDVQGMADLIAFIRGAQ